MTTAGAQDEAEELMIVHIPVSCIRAFRAACIELERQKARHVAARMARPSMFVPYDAARAGACVEFSRAALALAQAASSGANGRCVPSRDEVGIDGTG